MSDEKTRKEKYVEQVVKIEPVDRDRNAQIAGAMVELVDEWHDNADSGYYVLASHALDRLKEMIEDVYP